MFQLLKNLCCGVIVYMFTTDSWPRTFVDFQEHKPNQTIIWMKRLGFHQAGSSTQAQSDTLY